MSDKRPRGRPSTTPVIVRSSATPSKGQKKDTMARKREERAARAAYKKKRQAQAYSADDESFATFSAQLAKMGLELREIPGDGNCLFRALGDQLVGHGRDHMTHRRDVCKFMREHRHDFEPFVEDDVPFDRHVKNLSDTGTYAGNDAIVAFARLHKLHVVIHQVNSPCWQIHGTDNAADKELHISYHNGDHYSSIRKLGDHSETAANIIMSDNSVVSSEKDAKKKKGKESWNDTDAFFYNGATEYPEGLEEELNNGDQNGYSGAMDSLEGTVETIMRLTGCEDELLVHQSLEDAGYNADAATDLIIQLLSSTSTQEPPANGQGSACDGGIWDSDGTATRIFGDSAVNGASYRSQSVEHGNSGAKPKLKQQAASQLRRSKKQEKKLRAEIRRRQMRLGQDEAAASAGAISSDDDFHIISEEMGTLKI